MRSIFCVITIFVSFAVLLPAPEALADTFSNDDLNIAKSAFKAASQERWKKARRLALKARNPLVLKTFNWFDYSRRAGSASFVEIASFVDANPDWPDQNKLRRRAEEAIEDNLPPQIILDWFRDHAPLTTDGRVQRIRALLAVGKTAEAQDEIRDTWINNNFSKRPEKSFYKRYRRYLSAEDHLKRLDRLLWEGRNWPSRRMMWKVGPDNRALAEARLMLRHRYGNVDKAISKVPMELRADPGLIYERLRWRRSKGRYESAVKLLNPPPENLVRADLWWNERSYLARQALQKGHITDAYRMVLDHNLVGGAKFAEAEWMAGWISLRFLNEPKIALKHFLTMYQGVNYPISRARGAYWVARSAEALDDQQTAEKWYRIAATLPTVYYGQLAASRLGPGHGLQLPKTLSAPANEADEFSNHELNKAMELLAQIGQEDLLKPFALALAEAGSTPTWRKMAAERASFLGRADLAISIAKKSSRDGMEIVDIAYPVLTPPPLRTRSRDYQLERPLVLAMIRQESAFRSPAKSHANARGLMQLMPATAKRIAHSLRIPYSKRRLTSDPDYNMLLGQTYVAGLIDEFEGSYVLSLAAYNAGPARARKWSRMNGTPGDKGVDNIDWIEMIPFKETRNYVQRVLENLQVYRLQLSKTEVAQTLEGDLSR